MGQDCILTGHEFGLDKEIAEGWVSRVSLWCLRRTTSA